MQSKAKQCLGHKNKTTNTQRKTKQLIINQNKSMPQHSRQATLNGPEEADAIGPYGGRARNETVSNDPG